MLLHPLDFLGAEDDRDLGFFPGMSMPVDKKLRAMDRFFEIFLARFRPGPIGDYLSEIGDDQTLRRYEPRFAH